MDRTRRALFPKSTVLKLPEILAQTDLPSTGVFKLRIEYDTEVRKTELVPYVIRPVNSLRVVAADEVRYGKKFADRAGIRRCLERKGSADDIIMTQRGHLTDASYANLALFDGNYWYTPAWPLLRGTRREMLLEMGVLRPTVIRARDLGNFQKVRLVNAMLEWEEAPEVGMEAVVL